MTGAYEILNVPLDVLKRKSDPVADYAEATTIICQLERAIAGMEGCAGLHASQIGVSKSCCIIRYGDISLDLVNPEIIAQEEPFIHEGEGCMSFRGRIFNVPRFKQVTVKYQAPWPPKDISETNGVKPKVDGPPSLVEKLLVLQYDRPEEEMGGLIAIAVQHEIDHGNGILLVNKQDAVEVAGVILPDPAAMWKPEVGRNDPCPCGSGRKYKKCCLR